MNANVTRFFSHVLQQNSNQTRPKLLRFHFQINQISLDFSFSFVFSMFYKLTSAVLYLKYTIKAEGSSNPE